MQQNPFLIHSSPFLISFQPNSNTGTNLWWFLADFDLFFTPDVANFQSKILATPISHGKNFRGVFFDVFCKYEPESEKNLSSRGIICWDTKLVSFLVHDCMVLAVRGVLMFRVQKYQEIESVITLGHDDIGWQMSRSGLNSSLNVGFSFPWKFPLLSYGYRSRGSERWLSLYFIATIVSSP